MIVPALFMRIAFSTIFSVPVEKPIPKEAGRESEGEMTMEDNSWIRYTSVVVVSTFTRM